MSGATAEPPARCCSRSTSCPDSRSNPMPGCATCAARLFFAPSSCLPGSPVLPWRRPARLPVRKNARIGRRDARLHAFSVAAEKTKKNHLRLALCLKKRILMAWARILRRHSQRYPPPFSFEITCPPLSRLEVPLRSFRPVSRSRAGGFSKRRVSRSACRSSNRCCRRSLAPPRRPRRSRPPPSRAA